MATPATRYAKSGGVHIAYQVFGDGPIDLVFAPGFISHVEHYWDHPDLARWLLRLASFARVIMFDKRGTGLSDRVLRVPSLEERMDDVRAVMDAVGTKTAAVLGVSEGGALAAMFAASHPGRCKGLVLYGAFARFPIGPERLKPYFDYVDRAWGSGLSLPIWAPSRRDDLALQEWWGRFERLGASPAAAVTVTQMAAETDVTPILSSIRAPTLVIHCLDDTLIEAECGCFLARQIPGARLIELPGADHLFFIHDEVGDAIEEFLTGSVSAPDDSNRVLATVLFTDIVGSTPRAEEMGDRRWRDLLEAHHAAVRRELARYRGREVKSLGDGFLAAFDGPARAVRCACAIADAVRPLDLQIRCGLHTGEVEIAGGDIRGIAVHIASRVSALAEPGRVLVSRTVKDLVAGSGLTFHELGRHSLKGLKEPMELYFASR